MLQLLHHVSSIQGMQLLVLQWKQLNPDSFWCLATCYFHPCLKRSNPGNLWPDLCNKVAPYAKHVLEETLKAFEITGGILAFDRESLQNCPDSSCTSYYLEHPRSFPVLVSSLLVLCFMTVVALASEQGSIYKRTEETTDRAVTNASFLCRTTTCLEMVTFLGNTWTKPVAVSVIHSTKMLKFFFHHVNNVLYFITSRHWVSEINCGITVMMEHK